MAAAGMLGLACSDAPEGLLEVPPATFATLDDDLVAHWPLDEGSGQSAADVSGVAPDLSLIGAAWTDGRFGSALRFDGAGDHAATDANFDPPATGTLAFWIRISTVPSDRQRVLGLGDGWEVRMEAGGRLHFDLNLPGSNSTFVSSGLLDQTGRWYHVAAAFDVNDGGFRVYVDGALDNTGSAALAAQSADVLSLGVRTGRQEYFAGDLDDVRVWARELTDPEVASLTEGGSGNVAPTASAAAAPTSGAAPLQVAFDGSGSSDPDGTVEQYAWDFGDGGSSSEQSPSHTYQTAGEYEAILTVTDDGGATGTDTVTITVTEAPDTEAPSVPTNLTLDAASASQVSLSWDPSTDDRGVTAYRVYRDGTQIGETPNTTFTDGGVSPESTYSYTVSAVDAAGNESAQSMALVVDTPAPPSIWPTSGWTFATPAEMGMDEAKLDEARDYALNTGDGGGAGFVTRYGRVVKTWGDTDQSWQVKSVTKSIGSMLLGVAVGDGLLNLADAADPLHPSFGIPPESNAATGWLDDVTLLNLGTHTSGFGRTGGYETIDFEPGTAFGYSDAGLNWLGEILTIALDEDLRIVLIDRVLSTLGVSGSELAWRDNINRDQQLNGNPNRELASGVSTDVDVLARLGYLALHDGIWDGTQVLPPGWISTSTSNVAQVEGVPSIDPVGYPNASNHYGVLWWNNEDGAMSSVPTDAFYAHGFLEGLIVVIPSLDIVVARLGNAWRPDEGDDHIPFVDQFVALIVESVQNP